MVSAEAALATFLVLLLMKIIVWVWPVGLSSVSWSSLQSPLASACPRSHLWFPTFQPHRSFPVQCSFLPFILTQFRWQKVVYLIWCLMVMVYCNDSVTSWISVIMGLWRNWFGAALKELVWGWFGAGLKELVWGCWIILCTLGSALNQLCLLWV